MASTKRTTASRTAATARRLKADSHSWPAPVPSRAELASAFTQAFDLAEGRRLGHAARLSYIALSLAKALELPAKQQRAAFYAALFHDAGVAPSSAEVDRQMNLNEEKIFSVGPEKSPKQIAAEIAPTNAAGVVELVRAHAERGALVTRDLGFDSIVQEAILSHHERWDGHGYPQALKEKAIPIVGRLLATADLIESLISGDLSALAARRNLLATLGEHGGHALDPAIVGLVQELSRSDAFWLGLYNEDLPQQLAASCPEGPAGQESSLEDLRTFAAVFAGLADLKGEYTEHHSERTAELVERIAATLDFSEGRRAMLSVATLLHHIGLLGIPARVIAKPDILSLSEMQLMRDHPTYSQMVLEAVPGLREAATWVGAHHERPDGKGYPEMLEEGVIPLEARIIALADTYVALISDRPYRQALSHKDAEQVLLGAAGTQLDGKLVRLFVSLSLQPTSSRTARRSRRKR